MTCRNWNMIWLAAAATLCCSCRCFFGGGGGGEFVFVRSFSPKSTLVVRPKSSSASVSSYAPSPSSLQQEELWRRTTHQSITKRWFSHQQAATRKSNEDEDRDEETEDNNNNNNASTIQWELFHKYHNKGSWKGIWTTYDYMGDVSLETMASVNYEHVEGADEVSVSHTIVVGGTQSDCETCFDNLETKTIPVAVYTPHNFDARKTRLGACGMVVGPSLLRNGAMATELVLAHGDGRVRVIFQHAPVWQKGVEAGTGPPQGLKLFRCMVSREALRNAPPTAAQEARDPPTEGNPIFHRPVSPPDWHKKWSGTSWTWGPEAGNRGWSLEELEQEDAWQANMPPELWNIRLPGGLFLQTPRVITEAQTGILRLAWMPRPETLLRLEVGLRVLQPVVLPDDDDVEILAPPSLVSYRCDVLQKVGDLEGMPSFVEQIRQEELEQQRKIPSTAARTIEVRETRTATEEDQLSDDDDSDLKAIQSVLQL